MQFLIAYLLAPLGIIITLGETTVAHEARAQEPVAIMTVEQTPVERAVSDIPHESPETTAIIEYLYTEAPKHDIDPDPVARTIFCESRFYNIQSAVVVDGVREPSYGLAQIHLPSHPTVSVEQALDPYFSVDWMLDHWHSEKWYGYDRESETCTNDNEEYWN